MNFEKIKEQYPSTSIKAIEEIYGSDPSPSKKYFNWMIREINKGSKKEDIFPSIILFDKYNSRLKNKDFNKENYKIRDLVAKRLASIAFKIIDKE